MAMGMTLGLNIDDCDVERKYICAARRRLENIPKYIMEPAAATKWPKCQKLWWNAGKVFAIKSVVCFFYTRAEIRAPTPIPNL